MLLKSLRMHLRGRAFWGCFGQSRRQESTTNYTGAPATTLAGCLQIDRFLESYDTFIFDCDGVLWKTDHETPLPKTDKAIHKLHALNKKVLYVTNNSILSRKQLEKKFIKYGFEANYDDIFGNAFASALYLKNIAKINGKVYVVGSEGIKSELDQIGISNFGVGADTDKPSWQIGDMLKMQFEDDVSAVIVGFDEYFSFNKIYKAASYLQNPNCHFIATNWLEKGVTIGENRRHPVTGTFVTAIRDVSQREPVVIGKPERLMFDCLKIPHPEIEDSKAVYIGDNLRADIGFAKNVGIDSVFVLTGSGTLDQIKEWPHLTPNFILPALGDIV